MPDLIVPDTSTMVPLDPSWVDIDLIYATERNFTGKRVYFKNYAYLHQDAIVPLKHAVSLLKAQDLTLRVYDAYRPQHVQDIFWDSAPDADYVAPPTQGSNHTRGIAIDVTLVDAHGTVLDMGTEFDSMEPASWHDTDAISAHAQNNRQILLRAMTEAGFVPEPHEWWHYQLPNAEQYPLLSADFIPDHPDK